MDVVRQLGSEINSTGATAGGELQAARPNMGGPMKTVSKLFLSLCLVTGLGAAMAARAQIDSNVVVRANIPHPFVVQDTTLPAGKYTIRVADQPEQNMLEIRSADGRTAVFFETEDMKTDRTPAKNELVFDKFGDTYFLSQVLLKGDDSGNQLVKSKKERKLEEGGQKAERHSVALDQK